MHPHDSSTDRQVWLFKALYLCFIFYHAPTFYLFLRKYNKSFKALGPIRRVYIRVKDLTLKRNHWNSKLRFHCPMSPRIRPSQDLLPNHEERSPAERTPNHSDCLIPQKFKLHFPIPLLPYFLLISSPGSPEFLKFPEKRSINTPLQKSILALVGFYQLCGDLKPQSHPFQVVSDHKIIAVGAWM